MNHDAHWRILDIDDTGWRYLAIVEWYGPRDAEWMPSMVCRRHPCPLRLMRWVYLKGLQLYREGR